MRQEAIPDSLLLSWESQPLTDVLVIDSLIYMEGCPIDYPEVIIYDTWMGTTVLCDCLDEDLNTYYLNRVCIRSNTQGTYREENFCDDIAALAPVKQSSVNGVRYCGKRADNLSLSESTRPVADTNSASGYKCPSGF